MIVRVTYSNGSQYDLNIYRCLSEVKKRYSDIDVVYVTDTHVGIRFKREYAPQAWHLNRLSGRLLASIGKPESVEPQGYGIRWVRDTNDSWPCFKIIHPESDDRPVSVLNIRRLALSEI